MMDISTYNLLSYFNLIVFRGHISERKFVLNLNLNLNLKDEVLRPPRSQRGQSTID